jgi:hypothetical protein
MKSIKFLSGIILAVFGLALATIVPLYSPDVAIVTTYFIPMGFGVFFFGLSILILVGSQDKNNALMTELQKINRRLDSTIVLPQNIIRVPDHERNERRDVALALWGLIIGVWAGVLGGLVTGSMFEMLDHEPTTPINYATIVIFLSSTIALGVITWYVKQTITRLMPPIE